MILSYYNDIFIAISYQFEIFVVIDCKNNWYQVIKLLQWFFHFKLLQKNFLMQYSTKVSIATNNYKLLQVIISYFGVVIADKNQTSLPYSIC